MTELQQQSVTEQFGLRWSAAADRYVRTWLDFVFRGPRRFFHRRGLDPSRYTSPTTFFIDSLVLSAAGSWAYAALKKGADAESARDRIALQASAHFGQTIIALTVAVCVVSLAKYRRGKRRNRPWFRLRKLFNAFAYSSSVLLLAPFLDLWTESWFALEKEDDINNASVGIAVVVIFSVLHLFYLYSAIAATHHIPIRRVLIGAAIVMTPFLTPLLFYLPWEEWTDQAPPSENFTSTLGTVNAHLVGTWAPLSVSKKSRSPHSVSWGRSVILDRNDAFVHFRILCNVTGGGTEGLRVILNSFGRREIGRSNESTTYMSTVQDSYRNSSDGYAEIIKYRRQTLEWMSTAVFECQREQTMALIDGQDGHEVLLNDGLQLGDWERAACVYVVVTFRVKEEPPDGGVDYR